MIAMIIAVIALLGALKRAAELTERRAQNARSSSRVG
jgi:hypothetical protein